MIWRGSPVSTTERGSAARRNSRAICTSARSWTSSQITRSHAAAAAAASRPAQGGPGKIDLVPPAGALQALLVELGHGVQRDAVVAEVRRALSAQGEVIIQREQGPGEVRGVPRHQVCNDSKRRLHGIGSSSSTGCTSSPRNSSQLLNSERRSSRSLRLPADAEVAQPRQVFHELLPFGSRGGSVGHRSTRKAHRRGSRGTVAPLMMERISSHASSGSMRFRSR